ncbi:MAG: DUF547 domain-containing protein [Verrucomicrobia bacterium]|nr:DUF547 domain-containing protein [Verrucomicrobiota bacterium]
MIRNPLFALLRSSLFGGLCFATAALLQAAEFDQDHEPLRGILQTYVKDGLVDYAALKTRRQPLDQYLAEVASVAEADFKGWTEPRRLSFLLNAYNAYTLQLIIDHYPVKSIKDIGSFFKGPWDQPVVRLFGRTLTLNNLEHDIIRKDYPDPRIHFALVCAARGCPPLREEAYLAARLDEQLDDQARQFLATPTKNRVDAGARTVYLSPIFKWYGADFEKKHGSVLAALQPYWPKASTAALAQESLKIRYDDYDWSLNQTTR